MDENRKKRMDELSKELVDKYLETREDQYIYYSDPLEEKTTGQATKKRAIVMVYIVESEPTMKATGLPPSSQVKKCPRCGKPM